jgi:L-alanine-DL-glutamate epimerase-like enolase superfamily enzyme
MKPTEMKERDSKDPRKTGAMIIRDVVARNLTIPYDVPYRPRGSPGLVRDNRAFTIVKIVTEDGIVGFGGSDGHQARTIESSVKPYLLGKPAWATELHARTFRNAGGTWFVDLALWDVIGKTANLPLYKIWGACREKIQAYASTSELGTPAGPRRARPAVPIRRLSRAEAAIPQRDDGGDLALLDAAMGAAPGMTVMIDANQATFLPSVRPSPRWDYRRALTIARELEARDVLWLEEPLPKFDYEGLARLVAETDLYIAGGESNRELHEFQLLIERGCYDIIQPDCCLSEGHLPAAQDRGARRGALSAFHPAPRAERLRPGGDDPPRVQHAGLGAGWIEMMYEPPTRNDRHLSARRRNHRIEDLDRRRRLRAPARWAGPRTSRQRGSHQEVRSVDSRSAHDAGDWKRCRQHPSGGTGSGPFRDPAAAPPGSCRRRRRRQRLHGIVRGADAAQARAIGRRDRGGSCRRGGKLAQRRDVRRSAQAFGRRAYCPLRRANGLEALR